MLVDHIPVPACRIQGSEVVANERCRRLLGIGDEADPLDAFRPADRAALLAAAAAVESTHRDEPTVVEVRTHAGPPRRFFSAHLGAHPDAGALVVLTETTQTQRLDAVVAELASGLYIADASDGGLRGTWMPDRVAAGLGITPDLFVGTDIHGLIHPDDVAVATRAVDQAKANPGVIAWANVRITHPLQPDGYYPVLVGTSHLPGDDAIGGTLIRFDTGDAAAAVHRDGTLTLRDANPVGFFNLSVDGAVVQRSSRMRELLRPVTDDDSGREWLSLVRADDRSRVEQALATARHGHRAPTMQVGLEGKGAELWIDLEVVPYRNDAGQVNGMFVTMIDLTAEREARRALAASQEELWRQARSDVLTGLGNRTSLVEGLTAMLTATAAADGGTRGRVALLLCDLDGFKAVNDRHGHRVGDLVLDQVARRLEGAVRVGDLVVRFGGDEFVVACAGLDEEQIEALAARIVETVRDPIVVDGAIHHLGVSVGVAHEEPGDVEDLARLVKRADDAMYAAKSAGGARVATA